MVVMMKDYDGKAEARGNMLVHVCNQFAWVEEDAIKAIEDEMDYHDHGAASLVIAYDLVPVAFSRTDVDKTGLDDYLQYLSTLPTDASANADECKAKARQLFDMRSLLVSTARAIRDGESALVA